MRRPWFWALPGVDRIRLWPDERESQRDMTYWDSARARATRRKSAWNLLLIPTALVPWFLGWWLSAMAFGHVYHLLHPHASFVVLPETVGGIAIAVGLLFAWCPVAMMLANLLVHAVPAARRALDREASTVRGTDFRSSNRQLVRLAAVLIPVGIGAATAGVLF